MWTKHPIAAQLAYVMIKGCATLQCDVNSLQSNLVFLPQCLRHLGLNFAKETLLQFKALCSWAVFCQPESLVLPSSKDADSALSTRLWWGELMKKYNVMASGHQCLWEVSSWRTAFPLYDLYTSNCNRHLPRSNNSPADDCRIVSSKRWCQQT